MGVAGLSLVDGTRTLHKLPTQKLPAHNAQTELVSLRPSHIYEFGDA